MRLERVKPENILCWGCCYSSLWQAFALSAGKTKTIGKTALSAVTGQRYAKSTRVHLSFCRQ